MAKLRRSMTILWLVFGLLVLAAPSWSQTRPVPRQNVVHLQTE